jgi:sialate O-acetylesterase
MAADPRMKPMLDALDASVKFYRENPGATADKAPPHPKTINARPGRAGGPQRDPVQDQHFPTVLFNGMINPVIPYAIRGVIWYQGESIVGGTPGVNLYGHVQQALIQDWRKRWGQGNFPFYIVQLPGQKNVSNNPRIREEQAVVLSLPHTGMAVTIDTGEPTNVHPHNKAPVGDRLARLALAKVYGRKIEYSGPMYKSMKVEGGAIRVKFSHVDGGLVAKGGPLKGFQIAAADQKFVEAAARIDGETLIVSSPQVSAPAAVRYAWDNYPEGLGCNLYNVADLPAAPFRTDHWEYPLDVVEN